MYEARCATTQSHNEPVDGRISRFSGPHGCRVRIRSHNDLFADRNPPPGPLRPSLCEDPLAHHQIHQRLKSSPDRATSSVRVLAMWRNEVQSKPGRCQVHRQTGNVNPRMPRHAVRCRRKAARCLYVSKPLIVYAAAYAICNIPSGIMASQDDLPRCVYPDICKLPDAIGVTISHEVPLVCVYRNMRIPAKYYPVVVLPIMFYPVTHVQTYALRQNTPRATRHPCDETVHPANRSTASPITKPCQSSDERVSIHVVARCPKDVSNALASQYPCDRCLIRQQH